MFKKGRGRIKKRKGGNEIDDGERGGRSRCSEFESLGLFPGVGWVTEVTVRGGLEVDGFLEVKVSNCMIPKEKV